MSEWTTYDSPLGSLTLTAGGRGLTGLWFPEHAPAQDPAEHRPAGFADATAQLNEYFAGTRRAFELPLDIVGTAFQRAVWEALLAIPYGETVSYGELAGRIGRRDRIRAVGGAVGRTPVPIIVPCHRVIGADGGLTGYGGGLPRKRLLLDLEDAHAPAASGPRQLALL
jgi:methylated-DNA-[protein]-cysteine S-methyltransferase